MSATASRTARPRAATIAGRRWASGRELGLIEQLSFAYRAQLSEGSFLRFLPVAVDTNVLLRAIAREARGSRSDLVSAARLGVIRIYVGESVPAEVEEHLANLAASANASVAQLEEVWRSDVRPHLRVVETGTFEDSRLAAILARDPDDRPTAVLSLFIGARLTWSFDTALREGGYAETLNVEIVMAAQKVGSFDLSAHLALRISTEGLSAAGRAVVRAIERSGPERTVAIVVLLLAAGAITVALIKDTERVKQTAARIAQAGVEAMQEASRYRDTEGGKLPAIPLPATTERLPLRLAHALAVAPAPLTTTEIVAVLDATGPSVTSTEVETTLRGSRAFIFGRHGWQLGAW